MSSVPRQRAPVDKNPTVVAIRESRAKLTGPDLRRLREGLFKLQLLFIERMVEGGVETAFVAGLADCTAALAAIERLETTTRER